MLELDRGDGHTTFAGLPYSALPDPARHVGALLEARTFHPTRMRSTWWLTARPSS